MPPEPKKPIEELLEASAQARRTKFGGDPKMPNPMRARLQDEIARMAHPREPKSLWFAISWPRLVMGAAFACLLLGTTVWWRAHQPSEAGARFAMSKTAPAAAMNRLEQAPAASDKLESAPRTSMADRGAGVSNDNKTLSAGSVAQGRNQAKTNFTQEFSQSAGSRMTGSSAKLQKARKILDNFQVEQNGRDFRVVDDDGSTYAGRIEPLTPNDTRNYLKEKQTYAAPAAPAAAAKRAAVAEQGPNNEFYFRASGYNASLKKSVVFEGNYIVAAPPGKNQDAAAERNAEQLAARIVGTAKVLGEPPVQVDAVAVPAK
jgi:hypothetical protein